MHKISDKLQTQNQHIVPKVHLKSFLEDGTKKLQCFNIDELRLEKPQSLRSICSSKFYYSEIPGSPDEYGQIVEKSFGSLEDLYGKIKKGIEKQLLNKNELSDRRKYELSLVISNFIFRGYKKREEYLRMNDEIFTKITQGMEESETINGLTQKEFYEEGKKTSYATNLAFDPRFANALTHKKWEILINNSQRPFVTGDTPAIEYEPDFATSWPNFSSGLIVRTQLFHLSPRIAIIITFDPESSGEWQFTDVTTKPDRINESNLKYINFTHKYAYSSSNRFFEKVIAFESNKKNTSYKHISET